MYHDEANPPSRNLGVIDMGRLPGPILFNSLRGRLGGQMLHSMAAVHFDQMRPWKLPST
jgi:hypothetical protein